MRIMVVAEQREGKLNRVSLETLSAAQAIGKETGWPVEVVLPGYQTAALAQELAGYQVEKVYDLEAPLARSLYLRRVCPGPEGFHLQPTTQAGALSPHLPGTRFRTQAGPCPGPHFDLRRHRL